MENVKHNAETLKGACDFCMLQSTEATEGKPWMSPVNLGINRASR